MLDDRIETAIKKINQLNTVSIDNSQYIGEDYVSLGEVIEILKQLKNKERLANR